jgi:hypothetical protein
MDPSDGLDQYDWRFSQGGSYDDSFDESMDEEKIVSENNNNNTIVEV